MRGRHRRLAAAVLRGRRAEPLVRGTGGGLLGHPVLVLRGVLVLGRVLVLLGLVLRFARLLVLVLRRRVLLVLRRELRLLLRRPPLVLLGLLRLLLGKTPRVPAGGLLRHGRLAAAVLRLTPVLLTGRLAVLGLRGGLPVLGLAVLGLAVLGLRVLVGQGRPPRVRLLTGLLLGRAPRVRGVTAGRARLLVRSLVLGRLLVLVGLRPLLVRLAGLRGAVLLAALGRLRRIPLPLVVVAARRLLSVGAAADAREVGPAAHAEQVARLERFVTDRTFQGRHDTSPERTPARSSLDVRCSMSPLRGIPM
ncbi:hypothetical protein [Actinomadura hallensis]|uniref:hypothetical protein n=1 Tax=Actinomadura hallensis TaxID=337895 RepID=UPI00163A10CA|nr:hypothetical protein [Actinomadura hallensis]